MANVEIREPPSPEARFHASRGILLTQALRLTVRIATAAALARLISPREYGVFGMAALLHGLAYVVQDFGLASVTLRKATLGEPERTALFWLNASVGTLVAVAVAAASPLAAAFFREPLIRALLPTLAVTFVLNGLHAQLRAQLGREQRFAALNRIEIVAFVVSSAAAVTAAWLGAGCWALATLPLTAEVIIAIGIWHTQRWRPGRWPAGFSAGHTLRFGASLSGHEILRFGQRNVDQLFVGRWFGSGALGLYGRSAQLITLPIQYLIDPLATWAIATLSQAHATAVMTRTFWRRVLNGLAHLTLPLAVVFFCVPHDVLRIAFGPEWREGGDILRGLSIVLVAQPMLAAEIWLLIALGRRRRLLTWSVLTFVVVAAACWVGRGAGPATLASGVGATLVLVASAGALPGLRGLAADATDLFAAMARPLAVAVLAAALSLWALTQVPAEGAVLRFGLCSAITVASWGLAALIPGFRGELRGHFLLRSR